MRSTSLLALVLTVSAAAGTARAQAASPAGSQPDSGLVRVLDFVEHKVGQFTAPHDGFGVRFGGIDSGSALAAGPLWQARALDGAMLLRTSAAASAFGDYDLDAGVAVPEFLSYRLSLTAGGSKRHLSREHFYGLGMAASDANHAMFQFDRSEAHAEASFAAASWLNFGVTGGWADYSVADGKFTRAPSISTRFVPRDAPGLGSPASFGVVSASAIVDWRDLPGNPRNGGRYQVSIDRHADRSINQYSFTRAVLDVEQHVSWWRGQRVLSVRGLAVVSTADARNDVPFYLQPTLGGNRMMRGFATDRFRDRNLVWAQAEYGWDLWPFLGAVLFYESGAVAPEPAALSFKDLKHDYGIGFRLGSARTVAVRTDVAFGSGEGTRIAMRFSHAF